ncbi:hypothetical protein SBA6_900004 [Candidatus Sulfopaludibacter sp. SbA6]|nr:hypothetical protein SBA6_900004 [Candidatus Sulfopaludibacter sp. SbA6]
MEARSQERTGSDVRSVGGGLVQAETRTKFSLGPPRAARSLEKLTAAGETTAPEALPVFAKRKNTERAARRPPGVHSINSNWTPAPVSATTRA